MALRRHLHAWRERADQPWRMGDIRCEEVVQQADTSCTHFVKAANVLDPPALRRFFSNMQGNCNTS